MRKIPLLILLCLALSGCASPVIPDWTIISYNQLESFKENRLTGREGAAALNFTRALEEIKRSGNIDIMARAYLTRCALLVALLEPNLNGDYLRLENLQPMPHNANYFRFLNGALDQVDQFLLPEQYRDFFIALKNKNETETEVALSNIEDPLSRLIATGLTVRYGKYNAFILNLAVDTASRQGWKKALLVYLSQLKSYYLKAGDQDKARKIALRIALIKS